ncbi:hypothetical protein [Methylorubrum sp. SB2]|uniref:hypothetical protein n=1 Tax=Methylorubrum subtropicum TaxID=3138812 RepID=UPI00313A878B
MLGGGPARAGKLVGVVFDDSGSMQDGYKLPLAGLQMLASTLDGRPGGDRLLVTRFGWYLKTVSGQDVGHPVQSAPPYIRDVPLGSQTALQASVRAFSGWTISQATGTPYQPVRSMLETLAEQAEAEQDVHLVVLTDGAFETNPESRLSEPSVLVQEYQRIREELGRKHARLTVHFLLILNGQPGPTTKAVSEQKVRSGLLEVFNNAKDAGLAPVQGFDDLRSAMLAIIGRISETDARRSSSVIVGRSDDAVQIKLPFAVSRIIALSTAQGQTRTVIETADALPRPVQIRKTGSGPEAALDVDRLDVSGGMNEPDRLEAWKAKGQLFFHSTQLTPRSYLQPGPYKLAFDKRPRDDLVLLFRTDLSVAWSLLDRERVVAGSEQAGTVTVPVAQPLTLDIKVRDKLAGDAIANFRDFPQDATFEATLVDGDGNIERPKLRLDRDRATVRGPVTFSKPGRYKLSVAMRVAGAPSKSSGLFEIEARRNATFAMAVDPGSGGNGQFSVDVPAGPASGDPRITTILVTPGGVAEGEARIKLRGLPPGTEAVHDGRPLPADGEVVPFKEGEPIRLEVRRTSAWTGHADGHAIRAETVVEVDEVGGGGSFHGTLAIATRIPPARLVYRGAKDEAGGLIPVPVSIKDLAAGKPSFAFALEGALTPPTDEDFVFLAPEGLTSWMGALIGAKPRVTTSGSGAPAAIEVRLEASALSCCLLGWLQGRHEMSLAYRPKSAAQNAAASAPFDLNDEGRASYAGCWLLLGLLLALAWLIGWLVTWATADRFPKRAVIVIERANAFPEQRGLAYVNYTAVKAMGWPVYWVLNRLHWPRLREQQVREGLRLVARQGGVDALPAGSAWPDYKLEHTAMTLELESPVESGRPPNPVMLPWGSVLLDERQKRIISLWQRRSDFQARYGDTFEY